MNKEELKEVLKGIVHQEFKNELDSSRIFAYVQNLEQKIDKVKEVINQNFISYSSCIKAFDEIEEILNGKE